MIGRREERKAALRRDIQERACRLVAARGLDGFTMDDLAAAVGVSRRTLFNHVPDKLSAVLGEGAGELQPAGVADFAAGGPTGDLVADTVALLRTALARAETEVPDAPRRALLVERAVAADPKVAAALRGRCERAVAELVGVICAREGWPDGDLRARVLTGGVVAVVVLMLEEVVRRDGSGSFVEILEEILAAGTRVGEGSGLVPRLPAS